MPVASQQEGICLQKAHSNKVKGFIGQPFGKPAYLCWPQNNCQFNKCESETGVIWYDAANTTFTNFRPLS